MRTQGRWGKRVSDWSPRSSNYTPPRYVHLDCEEKWTEGEELPWGKPVPGGFECMKCGAFLNIRTAKKLIGVSLHDS